jgi:hypothetical protein
MSAQATAWAWDQELPPARKFVLLALANRADEVGVCWPSARDLGHLCGLSRSQVWRHVDAMKNDGLLRVANRFEGGRQTSNIFVLSLPGLTDAQESRVHATGGDAPTRQGVTRPRVRGRRTDALPEGRTDAPPVTNKGEGVPDWATRLAAHEKFDAAALQNGWVAKMEEAYPLLNLSLEAEAALEWIENAAPSRKPKGVKGFFMRWCAKAEADRQVGKATGSQSEDDRRAAVRAAKEAHG